MKMRPAADYRNFLWETVVSGIPIRMEVAMESIQKFFWMLRPPWLVFVQNNGLVRISAGSVQPQVAVALRFLPRLVENLQGGFIRMENFSFEQFLMQTLIHGSQIVLRSSQDPV